jgi:hypothetical protein
MQISVHPSAIRPRNILRLRMRLLPVPLLIPPKRKQSPRKPAPSEARNSSTVIAHPDDYCEAVAIYPRSRIHFASRSGHTLNCGFPIPNPEPCDPR